MAERTDLEHANDFIAHAERDGHSHAAAVARELKRLRGLVSEVTVQRNAVVGQLEDNERIRAERDKMHDLAARLEKERDEALKARVIAEHKAGDSERRLRSFLIHLGADGADDETIAELHALQNERGRLVVAMNQVLAELHNGGGGGHAEARLKDALAWRHPRWTGEVAFALVLSEEEAKCLANCTASYSASRANAGKPTSRVDGIRGRLPPGEVTPMTYGIELDLRNEAGTRVALMDFLHSKIGRALEDVEERFELHDGRGGTLLYTIEEAFAFLTSRRIAALEGGIRKHRDARGTDRCYLDDDALYALLPEGGANVDRTLPSEDKFLADCRRFWHLRKKGVSADACSAVDRIASLEKEVADLTRQLAERA